MAQSLGCAGSGCKSLAQQCKFLKAYRVGWCARALQPIGNCRLGDRSGSRSGIREEAGPWRSRIGGSSWGETWPGAHRRERREENGQRGWEGSWLPSPLAAGAERASSAPANRERGAGSSAMLGLLEVQVREWEESREDWESEMELEEIGDRVREGIFLVLFPFFILLPAVFSSLIKFLCWSLAISSASFLNLGSLVSEASCRAKKTFGSFCTGIARWTGCFIVYDTHANLPLMNKSSFSAVLINILPLIIVRAYGDAIFGCLYPFFHLIRW